MNEIPVAAAVITNSQGKVLIAQRAEPVHLRGLWEFPGGKIEDGEDPAGALIREIREELDMEIRDLKFLGEFPYHYGAGVLRLAVFLASASRPEFKVLEHLDVRWVSLDELDGYPMSPADLPVIPVLRSLKI